jgi:hypothetical protein
MEDNVEISENPEDVSKDSEHLEIIGEFIAQTPSCQLNEVFSGNLHLFSLEIVHN